MCGGTYIGFGIVMADGGLFPACAGEPPAVLFSDLNFKVYPRVCGGTPSTAFLLFCSRGLSPRVRGTSHCRWRYSWQEGLSPRVRGNPLQNRIQSHG